MRITHVQSSFVAPLGGAESYVLALASEQARRGDEVEILTAWTDPDTVERARRAGVAVRVRATYRPYRPDQHGAGTAAKIAFHALDVLGTLGPATWMPEEARSDAVVHVHRFQGVGAQVLRARHGAVVHTAHDYCLVDTTSTSIRDGHEPARLGGVQRLRARANWLAARRASILVFPSERALARHHALGMPAEGVEQRVVPHGWPAPAVSPARIETGGRTRPRFVFLGKLQATKGIDLLLRAWEQADIDAELVVAGDGPERPTIERAAATGGSPTPDGRRPAEGRPDRLRDGAGVPLALARDVRARDRREPAHAVPGDRDPPGRRRFRARRRERTRDDGRHTGSLARALRRLAHDATLREGLARGAAASAAALDFGRHVDRVQAVYADARGIFARAR